MDTTACGFANPPVYQTSLLGATNHWTLTGITALYFVTATGFRVYLRYSGGSALTPSLANSYGWQLTWSATPAAVQTPTLCSGQTPAGNTNWQANDSTSLYLDVNTAACGFTATPRYSTALSGDSHWTTVGVNALYQPSATGFRVYVRTSPSSALTPALANQRGWQVQWSAVSGPYAIVTQSYSFNGQRVAVRKDGVLTYLHADHLGSTLLATDASGAVVGGNQPRYFAYGRERTPSLAALPTDYTFTGQKQDGSGLIYMNARYYDPQIGQFISPDTEVPDPTTLSAYNRYMYVNGNPLRYNDPSGHGFWDVVNTTVDFVQGVGAQVGYNNTSLVPGSANIYYQKADESTAMTVGRHVGNVVSGIQSAAEIIIGAGGDVGGAALCGTGVGCVATPAVEAVGTAVMVHGAAVGASALTSEASLLSNVMMAKLEGKGGSDSGYSDYKGNMQNLRKLTDKEVRKYGLHDLKKEMELPANADLYVDELTGNVYYKVKDKNAPYQEFSVVPALKKPK